MSNEIPKEKVDDEESEKVKPEKLGNLNKKTKKGFKQVKTTIEEVEAKNVLDAEETPTPKTVLLKKKKILNKKKKSAKDKTS